MTKKIRVYTNNEIKLLLNSGCILGFRNNSQIIYKNGFKLYAVHERLCHPEKTARQIFEEAGINTSILDDRTPQKRINNWVKKYTRYGEDYFKNEKQFYSSKQKENIISQKNTNESQYYLIEIIDDELNLVPVKFL